MSKAPTQLREAGYPDPRQIVDINLGPSELDIAAAERILSTLRNQSRTAAGYPRIRPADCAALTQALETALLSNRPYFLLGDAAPARRFDAILEAYAETDAQFYPHELFRARLIQAEVRLLLGDLQGAREAAETYLEHPYALEGGIEDLLLLFGLDCRIRASLESPEQVGQRAMTYAVSLMQLRPYPGAIRKTLVALSDFVALGPAPPREAGLLRRWLHGLCRGDLAARRGAGLFAWPVQKTLLAGYGACALLLSLVAIRASALSSASARNASDVLVTRAMGGIGDLLMMTPGLRALAKKRGKPVKLAISAKFFAAFANNPHVELLDIDALPMQADRTLIWRNLTMCPAGAYEARRRPWVRRSRAELFAGGVGVRRAELDRLGWNVELFPDARQRAAADDFLRAKGLGKRPLVGVQPYSRDSYKDHPGMSAFIADLAQDYDVVVFHHVQAGLPSGPGIATTAGLALSDSLALVQRVAAMVSCDSAFLHAAAAFDVPVFAIFGPTDGALFTRHHRSATVFQNKAAFPCSPCWRNEDIPCKVTGRLGPSPCVSTTPLEPIRAALASTLASASQKTQPLQ